MRASPKGVKRNVPQDGPKSGFLLPNRATRFSRSPPPPQTARQNDRVRETSSADAVAFPCRFLEAHLGANGKPPLETPVFFFRCCPALERSAFLTPPPVVEDVFVQFFKRKYLPKLCAQASKRRRVSEECLVFLSYFLAVFLSISSISMFGCFFSFVGRQRCISVANAPVRKFWNRPRPSADRLMTAFLSASSAISSGITK